MKTMSHLMACRHVKAEVMLWKLAVDYGHLTSLRVLLSLKRSNIRTQRLSRIET